MTVMPGRARHSLATLGMALLFAIASRNGAVAQGAPGRAPAPSVRDTTKARVLDSLNVVGRGRSTDLTGIAHSASEGHIGSSDLMARPLSREGELLESVPGVILTQHSGDGKANQIFVRGFNLDHGTDFQTRLDGMPVNMPSHAHGQGYTDLNFIIPELVESIDYKLGVYHAEIGDFGSAGGAEFHLAKSLDRSFIVGSIGSFGFARVAAGTSLKLGGGDLLVGGEAKEYNGPWVVPERLRKFSGVVRYTKQIGNSELSIMGLAYHNRFNSSDQIPLRAVQSGLIDRFGQIDTTDGGFTQRYSLSGTWRHHDNRGITQVQLYGMYSDLNLFSDFTYFLDNPTQGDQFNQREHRYVVGGNVLRRQSVSAFGAQHLFTFGLQNRNDFVNGLGLYKTEARERLSTVRQDDVVETGSGVYFEAESYWLPWFRSVIGAREDLYTFDVNSNIAENSGHRTATLASPKASFVFTVHPGTELYLSGGLGFHSNDARGTTITVDPVTREPVQRVDPLVRSRGAEFGVRTSPVTGWRSTFALWALELNSELLFTGDGGTTEPSNRSRRYGATWANFYRPIPQLTIDADFSLAHARYEDVDVGQDRIPGALENVVAGGVTWQAIQRGVFGAIRVRHFGAYPLIEDNSARATPTTLVNADVGYLFKRVRLQVSVLNLFNQSASDIQYYYSSRLPGESAGGVNDVHFHPVEPRMVRVSLGWGL